MEKWLSLKQWIPNLAVGQNHPGSLLKITESELYGWGPRVSHIFTSTLKGFHMAILALISAV